MCHNKKLHFAGEDSFRKIARGEKLYIEGEVVGRAGATAGGMRRSVR